MRKRLCVALLVVLGATAAPRTRAGEVVQFLEGRFLRIRSHEVADGFVRLQLEGEDWLVVPAARIDFIQRGGRRFYPSGIVRNAEPQPQPARETGLSSKRPGHERSRLERRQLLASR